MALRGNGTLITHNNATYIAPALMPGYCGHVPSSKFLYGDTFGNSTIKYFQDFRSGAMAVSTGPYSRGGMFPSLYSNTGLQATAQRAQSRLRTLNTPCWARFNVDFDRQEALKTFGHLSQTHREHYRDTTGTRQPVKHFVVPVKESDRYQREPIDLPHMKKTTFEGGVRRYQTLPSGLRTSLDDRVMRDVFFERR